MADINPDDIPFLLGKQDAVADQGGKPTTVFLDWLQGLWSWMKRSVVDLTTKITTVQSSTDNAHARITTEIIARTSADEALASQITTVEASVGSNTAAIVNEATARANGDSALATSITSLTATVGSNTAAISAEATARVNGDSALASSITSLSAAFGGFTASGAVYFAAMAGPPGSAAAYGIYLTAGNVFTGLQLVARSDGSSYIAMTAGQLFFYDNSSGSTINALTYSGGEWLLNGNVTLQSANGAGSFRYADGNIVLRDASNNALIELGINI